MVNLKTLECEGRRLRSFGLLPHKFKTAGFVLGAASVLVLVVLFATSAGSTFWKMFCQNLLLISMLLVSITREKDEDEYNLSLRARSYMMAFVAVVLYTVVQPYINYGVANLLESDNVAFESFGSFVVIWFMLFVQLGFYYLLRATR
ncbi:MAG: hypothetical protein WBB45_05765 [Cyclobacteriaceae bacterium]